MSGCARTTPPSLTSPHSLPLGEDFPSRSCRLAARSCRLAAVVLSEEYAQSKWPMLELVEFFASTSQPKILPLFLKLTADDLKQEENLDRWRSAWQKFAERDPSRIDAVAWEDAFKKVSSRNGIALNKCEEESAYVERVFSGICESVPPSIRHDFSGIQGIHRLSEIVLAKFKALDNDKSKVCVLGMYGLPGSGKSTICRYLSEHLFSQFAGKAIYLELPTDADDEELLIKAKQLLEKLTNFNNKMDLTSVSNFRQVYYMLERTDFISARLFLVLDNISSQKSSNVVKALLRLSLTVGSKVLLVARSDSALRPLLQEDESLQIRSHYVYDSMSVPCLSEEEALRVLLQSGDGVGLADSHAPEAALTPQHKQILEEVLTMSGFPEESGCITYVPLVLKIMGEQFKEHELDVEKWSRIMKSFQIGVGLCKEEALRQMVLKSFKTFPKRLQVLFLDLALFIVPLSYSDGKSDKLDEVCSHLSLIHGCNPEEIEFEMQKLQQHGFLKLWALTISVHDFYLEFAASIEEASKYYWSSGFRWSKLRCNQAMEAVGTAQYELRTAVLELDRGYEHFEVLSGFSRVRAMVLRNSKSLKTLQGFKNFKRLVSLEIRNCPSLKWIEPPAYVRRFEWVNKVKREPNVEMLEQQELQALLSKKAVWRLVWKNLLQNGFMRSRMTVDSLLLQMRGLQIFRLENTGVRGCVDMSGCLPQLKILEVRERHMKCVCVCNLPNLERFVFFGDAKPASLFDLAYTTPMLRYVKYDFYEQKEWKSTAPRMRVVLGKNLLDGCPKLQEVCLQYVALNDIALASSRLRLLRVNGLWNGLRSPNLCASSEFLKELRLSHCQELRSLNLGCEFRNFQELYMGKCGNLTEVSGFGGAPMLRYLEIRECPSLKRVSGLRDLVSIQHIIVVWCPNIQQCLLPDLESLIELESITVHDNLWNGNGTLNVRKLVKLRNLHVDCSWDRLLGLENLERLGELRVTGHSAGLDLATVTGIRTPCCFALYKLELVGLENLGSLNGIEFLGSLMYLRLLNLQNFACLRGIEYLEKLEYLMVKGCASIEKMPSLAKLVKLQHLTIHNCKKLRNMDWCSLVGELASQDLIGCESLEGFPMQYSSVERMENIRGSEFASEQAVKVWVKEPEIPDPLSVTDSRTTIGLLMDMVVQKALDRGFNNEVDSNDDSKGEKDDNDDYVEDKIVLILIDLPKILIKFLSTGVRIGKFVNACGQAVKY